MPFKSEKQRRYMHANLPEIAQRWERDYASGGIARVGYQQGMGVAPFPPPNDLGNPLNDSRIVSEERSLLGHAYPTNLEGNWWGSTSTEMLGDQYNLPMDRMINPNDMSGALAAPYGVNPMTGMPYQKPRTIADQNRVHGQTFTQRQPAWYNQIFNKAGKGIRGLKNKMTEGYDQSQNFLKNIINNTMVGRIMAGFDATNPNAFNYNPALQGQIDFLKGTGQYGVMDPSGLNKITGGALAGKNLQSMFGSNDLAKMYDKSIARTEKTLANLPEQWSQLRTSDDPEDQAEYQRKLAYHRDFLQQKKDEQKKYFDSLKKKTTTGGKKNYITKTDQSGKGDGGGGSKFAGDSGAKAGTTGSWTPGGTYRGGGGHGSRTGMHRARGGRMNRGGLASLWQR